MFLLCNHTINASSCKGESFVQTSQRNIFFVKSRFIPLILTVIETSIYKITLIIRSKNNSSSYIHYVMCLDYPLTKGINYNRFIREIFHLINSNEIRY